jgi:dephospho-CoA kinase
MLRIGVTGGIGSGKTTVCRLFEGRGVPVYYADAEAKRLMTDDAELRQRIERRYGEDLYADGWLNRRRLASIIFNDKKELTRVNGWVHPAVAKDFERWSLSQTAPYVLEESAIIFECGMEGRFDGVVLVTAPEAVRISRVCLRDGVAPEAVRARLSNQWQEDRKRLLADYVIDNDHEEELPMHVEVVHQALLLRCSE